MLFKGKKINEGVKAIQLAYQAGENIVIHCAAGRSRSVTVLMAFLLHTFTSCTLYDFYY